MTGAARRQSSTEPIDTTVTIISEKSKDSGNHEIDQKNSSGENDDFSSENSDDNSTEINDFEFVQNVCDISSESYGKYDRHLHNQSVKSIYSAFPLTPANFTKERGSPSILSDESLFSSQMSYADDENVARKKNKFSSKKSSYYNKRKKFIRSSETKVNDSTTIDNHVDNHDEDEKDERKERKERRASVVSKEEEAKIKLNF